MINNLYPYLLKFFLDKRNFEKYRDVVDTDLLRRNFKEYNVLFETLEHLHGTSAADVLTPGDLLATVLAEYPALKQEKVDAYAGIVEHVAQCELTQGVADGLVLNLRRSQHAAKLAETCYRVSIGELEWDKIRDVASEGEKLSDAVEAETQFVSTKLDELLTHAVERNGLRWRLNTMNRMLGSVRKGDFGFLMARPETGKTTFLSSEVSFMASQTEKPILWFNNEEQGDKVMLRIYEACLGAQLSQLRKYRERADARFHELGGGRIRLVDDALLHRKTVEKVIREQDPSLIVFDQIDKIKGFKDDRKDLELGSIYRWARALAKEYAPVIAVCQASAEADWVRWLDMSHAANAKTEKQAEADWILGIGRTNREGFENERYLHLSKNKLLGDVDTEPHLRHGKQVVYIQPEIGRYVDVG